VIKGGLKGGENQRKGGSDTGWGLAKEKDGGSVGRVWETCRAWLSARDQEVERAVERSASGNGLGGEGGVDVFSRARKDTGNRSGKGRWYTIQSGRTGRQSLT